ncbi:hypothetical protein MON38_12465 [Hymenobacter sp. DH14]|uniref:CBM-cenC domain-containing protein n=1 Tax=Hymenobacter cyanobacteriorum TaxID=2926463 RepID=A0A9X1VGL9_9BACT|nr:hypothetical protein [Hymenobacter cyanobacteriorum]MCI1188235.1 hypothetical protein [Hymenobacter cyanobacteriorum]
MKPLSLFAAVAFVTTLGSCSKDSSANLPEGTVTYNNFENVQGWGGANEPSVTTERAHSGKYSVITKPELDFGYTYVNTLGQMTGGKPKKITVSGWAWVPDKDANAALVVDIKHSPANGSQVFYGLLEMGRNVKKFGDWQEVNKTFDLPDSIASGNLCKVYMWRGSSPRPVYLDDVSIKIEK